MTPILHPCPLLSQRREYNPKPVHLWNRPYAKEVVQAPVPWADQVYLCNCQKITKVKVECTKYRIYNLPQMQRLKMKSTRVTIISQRFPIPNVYNIPTMIKEIMLYPNSHFKLVLVKAALCQLKWAPWVDHRPLRDHLFGSEATSFVIKKSKH